jgi:hypothetical protein
MLAQHISDDSPIVPTVALVEMNADLPEIRRSNSRCKRSCHKGADHAGPVFELAIASLQGALPDELEIPKDHSFFRRQ